MWRCRPIQAIFALFLLACSVLPASAASTGEVTPYLSGQYFTWREFNEGRQLLKESGALYVGGVLFDVLVTPKLPGTPVVRAKNEVFGGVVDYNGETQGASPLPVQTDVTYVGTRHEFDLGYRQRGASWSAEPFAGLGYRWWLRDLHDSATNNGIQVSGYTEHWETLYMRAGARGRVETASGVFLLAEGGAKYAFYTGNTVHFAGSGKSTFRPENRWSGFAEGGVSYQHLKLTASYEGFRFGASPVLRGFFQPESSSDIFGLNVGWSF